MEIMELIRNTPDKAPPFAINKRVCSVLKNILIAQTKGDRQPSLHSFKEFSRAMSTMLPSVNAKDIGSIDNASPILLSLNTVPNKEPLRQMF